MEAVTIQKLSKTYPGGKEALKQLSLSLSTGEVFGFLGPNGAGKTTTVKLLTGVLTPSGGSCDIMGVNPNAQPEEAHLLSGIVTEHAQMYDNLTGMENLIFYAAAFGLEQKKRKTARRVIAQGIRADRSERPKTGDLFYRYETEAFPGTGTAAPPEGSVS